MFGGFSDYDDYSSSDGSSDYSYDDSIFDEVSSGDRVIVPVSLPDLSYGDVSADSSSVAGWERCYDEQDAADATSCFQEYVASGEIDESFIPVALRFPECGYADVSWSGELYSMSDAEFVAAVEAARPCFMALVADGTLVEYEVPTEVAHLECFEGRNWYNTFDDPDYDQRYSDCLTAANGSINDTAGDTTGDTTGGA
jgi:hypothetical protein